MTSFLKNIQDSWRAMLALGGAILLGATIALSLLSFIGLPEEVEGIDERVVLLERSSREFDRKLDRLICYLTAERTNVDPLGCS